MSAVGVVVRTSDGEEDTFPFRYCDGWVFSQNGDLTLVKDKIGFMTFARGTWMRVWTLNNGVTPPAKTKPRAVPKRAAQ